MNLSRNEIFFLSIIVSITVVVAILLYRDFTYKIQVEGGEIVGKLILKRNTAQRKYTSQVVWEELAMNVPLYNQDSIRTGSVSEALIVLNDGTEIDVDENSLIILNITKNSFNINFEGGAVQINSAGDSDKDVKIKTGDREISLTDSDVKLSKSEGEDVNLEVKRGEVALRSGDREQKLGKDQVASLSQSGEVNVRKQSIRPLTPEDNSRIFTAGNSGEISFSWESSHQGSSTLQISSRRNFSKIVRTMNTSGTGTSISLVPGIYYWRLSYRNPDTGKMEYSTSMKFSLLGKAPVNLMIPAPGEDIAFAVEEPFVNFAWSRSDLATGYVLEIAQDKDFTSVVKSIDSFTTNIASRLSEGTYYWRVQTKNPIEEARTRSDVRTFRISKRLKLPAPDLIRPEPGKQLSAIVVKKEGVVFNWNVSRETNESEIQLSSDKSFASPILIRKTKGNFITLRENISAGEYYWRIRGLDAANNPSDYSETGSFRIVEGGYIRTITPKENETIATIDIQSSGVRFSWDNPILGGDYRLIVSRNGNLATPTADMNIQGSGSSVPSLNPGTYYWKVILIDSDGNELSASRVTSFTIADRLEDPTPAFPAEGVVVDMSERESLPFSWAKVRDAESYRFVLYKTEDARNVKLLEQRLNGNGFVLRDLTLLDVGRFMWTIQAVKNSGSESVVSREIRTHFTIHLGGLEDLQITSPTIQYVEVNGEKNTNPENRDTEPK